MRRAVRWKAVVPVVVVLGIATSLTAAAARASSPEAGWHAVVTEDFEGAFPGSDVDGFYPVDWNGTGVGSDAVWDDTTQQHHGGGWSGSPTGSTVPPYANSVNTYMQAGHVDLSGATDARLSFWYWLKTEQNFDRLQWSYSCDTQRTWTGTTVSGTSDTADADTIPNWRFVRVPMAECAGHDEVSVRFWFQSDSSAFPVGGAVYVDDIRIEAFS